MSEMASKTAGSAMADGPMSGSLKQVEERLGAMSEAGMAKENTELVVLEPASPAKGLTP